MPRSMSTPPVARSWSAASVSASIAASRRHPNARHVGAVGLLERLARVQPTRTGRLEFGLFVSPAGHVVLPQAARVRAGGRSPRRAAPRRGPASPSAGSAGSSARACSPCLRARGLTLDLLVVFELDPQDARHLDRRPGRTRDRDHRVGVGRVDLLDIARGDAVPFVASRSPAITTPSAYLNASTVVPWGMLQHPQIRLGNPAEIGPEMREIDLQELRKARTLITTAETQRSPPTVTRMREPTHRPAERSS